MNWENKRNKISTSFSNIFDFAPVGILSFDDKWIITAVNQSFFEFGIVNIDEKEDLIGSIILDQNLFPGISLNQYLKQVAAGIPFETQVKSKNKLDGSKISVILKGAPISDNEDFHGGILVIEDIKVNILDRSDEIIQHKYFNQIFENFSDYYFLTDTAGKVLLHSSSTNNIYSGLFDKFSNNINEFFAYTESMALRNSFESAVKNSTNEQITIPLKHSSLEHFFNFQFQPISDYHNTTKFVAVLIRNKTDEIKGKIANENELNSLRKYRNITTAVVDAVINIDLNGKIIFWNDTASQLFNLSNSEVLSESIDKVIPTIDIQYLNEIKNSLNEKNIWENKIRFVKSDESSEMLSVKMKLIGDGERKSIVILCSNISGNINFEEKLKETESKLNSILSGSHELICSTNLSGKIEFANSEFTKVLGYSNKEILETNLLDLIDHDFISAKQLYFNKLLDEFNNAEIPLLKSSDKITFVSAKFVTVRDSEGKAKYHNAIFLNKTEQKIIEKELSMNKAALQVFREGLLLHSQNEIVLANEAFCKIFGYSDCREFSLIHFEDLISNNDKRDVLNYFYQIINGSLKSHNIEFTGIKKDGTEIIVDCDFASFKLGEELFTSVIVQDVSELKKNQKLIEESENRFRSITQNISDFMWTAELKAGKLEQVFYTDAVVKVTGYSGEEFISNHNLWHRIIHPNDVSGVIAKMKIFYRDISAADGNLEYRIIKKDGNIVWIRNSVNIIRELDGKIAKIYGSVRDISFSKKAEEKLIESASNLRNLNDTKDRFISIVSHDLRTPFSSILGFTDILLSEPEMPTEKRQEYINFIQESSRSMLSLVNSLLDWTRLQTGRIQFEPERLNARFVISKALQMVSGAALKKNIDLVSNVNQDVFVHADENLLLQVFNNFLSNAIKFTNSGGKIVIGYSPDIQNKQMEFFIEDNGTGIKEEDIPKLFKVDTKFTNPGTAGENGSGLGLSLCADIIEKHGGQVSVESTYGEGTKFTFGIPVSSTQILLVDDVNTDRLLYSKLLKSIIPNYSIVEAENGQEAFDKIKYSSPALVITDHKMPMMSGMELVQQLNLSEMKYKPPVIILSGDLNPSIIAGYKDIGVEYIFSKPVDINTFKFAVEKSLRKAIYS